MGTLPAGNSPPATARARWFSAPGWKVLHSPGVFSCPEQSWMKWMGDPCRLEESCLSRLIQQHQQILRDSDPGSSGGNWSQHSNCKINPFLALLLLENIPFSSKRSRKSVVWQICTSAANNLSQRNTLPFLEFCRLRSLNKEKTAQRAGNDFFSFTVSVMSHWCFSISFTLGWPEI